jgi:hypothetical protein
MNLKTIFLLPLALFIIEFNVRSQGHQVDFNTIPKNGTILVYAHMDDDLIWMLPFWQITEKFIGGAMPATPSYKWIVTQQQNFIDNNDYDIDYESNWITPWDDISDTEYTEYYWGANPAYDYLLDDHLETRLYNNYNELSRFEINKIKAKLEEYFADPSMHRVVTHNNWGEYGHRHHIGLNKAVRELAVKYRKDVWMLGCDNGNFIDVDVPDGIPYTLVSFDKPDLYLGIRTIYENNGRWTWYSDRIPSGDHTFIKIVEGGSDRSDILKGDEITYPGAYQLEPGAYIFDGDDDYMTIKGNNYESFTIAIRIRPDFIRGMDISAMSEYPGSQTYDRNIYLHEDGKITARIFDGISRIITSDNEISAGEWSHVAITADGNSLKLYLNGRFEGSVSTGAAISSFSTPEFILGQAIETDAYFQGQMSNVRLFNYALTENEIAVLSGMVYNITSINSPGGSISPSGNISVSAGSDITFDIIPSIGFRVSDVKIDDYSVGAVSTYTFTNVSSDHTINATFVPTATFTITSAAGTGGSINPSGIIIINEGSNQTFSIIPEIGFRIAVLLVDSDSKGTVSSFTFTNVTSNHTISAAFEPTPTYTITASSGSGGSITPPGVTTLNEGSSQTYQVVPADGYRITDVLIDNVSVGPVSTYSFSSVTSNHTISASFSILTYTINASAETGGSINPSGTITLNHGSSQTFTFSPEPGMMISSVTVDNVSAGNPSQYTFSNITDNHSIRVWFSVITNTISASAGTGGRISPQGNVQVNYGEDQSFSIEANTGYYVSGVLVDNNSAGPVTNYTFNDVTSPHSISASFSRYTYTINTTSGSGGSINPSGSVIIPHGDSRTFDINPAFGFQVSEVRVDNISAGAISSYTFSNVTENHSIYATFETAIYDITASAGDGGSISPSGTMSANHGSSRSFTITPAEGFQIRDVRVDNVSVGAVSSYSFSNISADHSISASFETIKFNIRSSAGNGGSVSPDGNIQVDYGRNMTFSITPAAGYRISNVLIDNVSVGPVSSYTFSNVTDNHTVSAEFSIITFSITAASGAGGSVNPTGTSNVNYGSSLTYIISPNTGYLIDEVRIDNVSHGSIASYTFQNITSSHNISVSFRPITFTISSSAKSGGSINSSGEVTVNYGSEMIYNILPDPGFDIENVLVDNKPAGPLASYTFRNITQNHEISALFVIKKFKVKVTANQGGTVSPHGETIVKYGDRLALTFAPDYGFRISDVSVNNASVGSVSAYTLENITDNHTVNITFKPIASYTITSSEAEGGSVTPSGTTSLLEGSDLIYQINPAPGYHILNVIIDNVSVGPVSEYTFTDISANHRIEVIFTTKIEVRAYPNPFADRINFLISSPEGCLFDLSLTDISGKNILTCENTPGNEIIPFNLNLPKGIYFMRIYLNGKKISIVKVVKS